MSGGGVVEEGSPEAIAEAAGAFEQSVSWLAGDVAVAVSDMLTAFGAVVWGVGDTARAASTLVHQVWVSQTEAEWVYQASVTLIALSVVIATALTFIGAPYVESPAQRRHAPARAVLPPQPPAPACTTPRAWVCGECVAAWRDASAAA